MLTSGGWELVGRNDVGFGGGESKDGTEQRGGEVGSSVRFEEEEVVVEVGEGGGEVGYRMEVGFDGESVVKR